MVKEALGPPLATPLNLTLCWALYWKGKNLQIWTKNNLSSFQSYVYPSAKFDEKFFNFFACLSYFTFVPKKIVRRCKGVGRKFSRGGAAEKGPKISKKYRKIALIASFRGGGNKKQDRKIAKKAKK